MVVYFCGSTIRYESIPKAMWEDVDACIAAGDEILAGNDGFGHRVYGRCKSRQYENASVYKTDTKRVKSKSKLFTKLSYDEDMLEKCDRMIAVWDGESQEVLVNILLLLALQKKCRLYYLPSGECLEISSVDELEPLVPDREGWTPKFIRKVLKTCGFSKEMLDYTIDNGIPTEQVMMELVCQAPISLKKKHELLDGLLKRNNISYEMFVKVAGAIRAGEGFERVEEMVSDSFGVFGDSLYDAIREISMAENGLKYCTYYLFDEWYDTDVFIERSNPCGMFGTIKQVMEYIRKWKEKLREIIGKEDDSGLGWYRIEAWNMDAWDKYEHTYNYYVYNDEICWFHRIKTDRDKDDPKYYQVVGPFFGGNFQLDIPTPFKAGDIVEIDCRPFGPPFRALVVEGRDQHNFCFPKILFKVPFTDKWKIAILKNMLFYRDADCESYTYRPKFSPLYRMRSISEDELTRDDEMLSKISKWIGRDENRGAGFWKTWCNVYANERTAAGVWKILRLVES